MLGEPTVWNHWPWPRTRVTTCKSFLTVGCPVKECRTSKLPPARSSGNIKRREKTSVHMSYQPPGILLAGNHLGWMMGKPPGKTLSQSDWPEPTPKLTQLPWNQTLWATWQSSSPGLSYPPTLHPGASSQ